MADNHEDERTFSRLAAARQEQTPQALARLAVSGLFAGLWFVLWLVRIPMPFPFLLVLLVEITFFLIYLRLVALLPSQRTIRIAQYYMLGAEIVFHTTIVYFLGTLTWLGSFAYVFGLIFSNAFLDLRRGLIYTAGAASAFCALIVLEATGVVPHHEYLEQGPLRYQDPQLVATTIVGAAGVFFSIYLWASWVGRQLRVERDSAVQAQDGLIEARFALQRANVELEARVTERTAELESANAALREKDERLTTVIQNTPVVLFALDCEGVFTLAEGKGIDVLGLTADEIVGQSALTVYQEIPDVYRSIQRALAGNASSTTVRVREHILDVQMAPVRSDASDVTGVIGVAADVTERRQAEAALHESEERLRTVVSNASVVLFAIDREGVFTLSEGRGLEALGLKAGEVVGRSAFEVYRDVPELVEDIRRCLDGESFTASVEVAGLVFQTHYAPIRNGTGAVSGLIGVATDITEAKQAEEAVRQSEELLRATIESTADGILVVDREGKVAHANGRFVQMWRISDELFATRDDDRLLEYVLDQLADPDVFLSKVRELYQTTDESLDVLSFKDGRVFERYSRPLLRDEEVAGRVWSFRDITQRKRSEDLVRASEAILKATIESTADGILVLNARREVQHTNARFAEMWRIPPDLAETRDSQRLLEFVLDQLADPDAFVASITDLRKALDYNDVIYFRDGRIFERQARALQQGGAIDGHVITFRDITQRKRAEDALRESETKFRTMAETVAAAVFIYQGTEMRYVNSAAEGITGYSRKELLAMDFWDVIHPDVRDLVKENGFARQRGERVARSYEVKIATKGGEERWVDFTAGVVEFEGAPAVLGTAFDITERKRAEDALREAAMRDPLTRVLNHAAVVEQLKAIIVAEGAAARCAVAMVDVDGLKATNDTYGHQVGDQVLLAIAGALSQPAAIVGRYGGDEFIAILPRADRAAAQRYRSAVLETLSRTLILDQETGARVPVVASVGLAIYPDEADTVHELIGLADSAMYTARRERPVGDGGLRPARDRALAGDRAAQMVGEIVPLLTSPGDLNDKLRLVSHRLSVGAGYDGVNFALFQQEPGPPAASNTFAQVSEELVEAWDQDQRRDTAEPHPIRLLFERAPRPVILHDPWNDELLLPSQRDLLRAAELRSVLVAPMIWQGRVMGSLGVASRREEAFTARDAQFVASVATQVTAIVQMASLVDELQESSSRLTEAQTEAVLLLAAAAEAHDEHTGRHLQRVRALAEALARELEYTEDAARELGLAAVLHDIGKIRVPDSVLTWSGELDREEWEIMKHHTTWGGQFLAGRRGFELAAVIARCHHERWDGKGYPEALAGDAIPEPAAIVAVADSFDAMVNDRPYRPGRSVRHAVREIVDCAGKQFSPRVVEALLRLHKRRLLNAMAPRSPRKAA